MAYQPIQMPQPESVFSGLGDAIMAARRQSEQENSNRANLLLHQQQAADEARHNRALEEHASQSLATQQQEAASKIAERQAQARQGIASALDSGRPDIAHQLASAYGVSLEDVAHPGMPRPPMEVPQTPVEGPQMAPNDAQEIGIQRARVFAGDDASAYAPEMVQQKIGETEAERQRFAAAQQPTRMQEQAPSPAGPDTYKLAGLEYDPQQKERAAEADRKKLAERARASFAPMGPEYADTAAGLAGMVSEPDAIAKAIETSRQRQIQRDSVEANKQAQMDLTRELHDRDKLTREEQIKVQADHDAARRAMGGAGAAPRADQADIAAYKFVDQTIGRMERDSNVPKLISTMEQFKIAAAELEKPSGAAQVGARMAVERALRGGPPTQYMDEQEQKHLSGIWGRMQGAAETLNSGEFGEEQKNAIRQEIQAAAGEFERFIDHRYQMIAKRVQTDPSLIHMKGTANARVKQMFSALGRDVPDVFPGAGNDLAPIGSRSVAGNPVAGARADQNGARADILTGTPTAPPEDVNSEAPLPEDPAADVAPPIVGQKAQHRAAAPRGQAPRGVSRQAVIDELKRRGLPVPQ